MATTKYTVHTRGVSIVKAPPKTTSIAAVRSVAGRQVLASQIIFVASGGSTAVKENFNEQPSTHVFEAVKVEETPQGHIKLTLKSKEQIIINTHSPYLVVTIGDNAGAVAYEGEEEESQEEQEDEEEEKPKRGRKPAAKTPAKPAAKKKVVDEDEEDDDEEDDEEEEEAPAPKKGAKKPAAKKSASIDDDEEDAWND